MNFNKSLKIAGVISGVLLAQTVSASHFRGGAIVPSVDANGLVSFTATTFWRRLPTATSPFPVSGTTTEGNFNLNGSSTSISNTTRIVDLADSRYARVVETYNIQLPSSGTHTIEWNSCCHVSGIANSNGGAEDLTANINWDGSSANTPIFFNFSSINPEVIRGSAYNDNLSALSGNGQTLSYDQQLSTSITGQPAPSFIIDPNTGQLSISATDTAAMTNENGGQNIGADYAFSGNIHNQDGSSVEFEWLFDAVNQASNLAPIVNDMVINVFLGDIVSVTVTGSDPNSDPLTWSLLSFLGTGDNGLFNFDPITQLITWDTTGSALGTYLALISASDGLLTDTGTITINVLQRGITVPEPGAMGLIGIGLAGMGFVRRRKRKN